MKYYSKAELVTLYKQQILSMVEYRTPAIHHATSAILRPLDNAQQRFLRALEISEVDALESYNLAPLSCRRDMAILGLLHRTVIGEGPGHFRALFGIVGGSSDAFPDKPEYRAEPMLRRSAFGYIRVYNALPRAWRRLKDVSSFQGKLQESMKKRAATEVATCSWKSAYSPRIGASRTFV